MKSSKEKGTATSAVVVTEKNSKDKKEEEKEPDPISYFKLFRYATTTDVIYMIIGTIASIANGVSMPIFSLVFGQMANSFDPSKGKDALVDLAGKNSLIFLYVGFGAWFASYVSFATWMITGERQSNCFRREYFKAILRQDISYFDKINPNELTTKISNETKNIQNAIGEKVTTFFQTVAMTIGGFIIGFIYGWQLALVLSATLPVMAFAGYLFTWILQVADTKTKQGYEKAGAYAEQALNALKTVLGLTGEEKEMNNYNVALDESIRFMLRFGFIAAIAFGLTMGIMILDYALGFWYGSVLVEDQTYNPGSGGPYTVGDVLTVFFTVIMGAFSIGQASPCLKAFGQGKVAAARVFELIDRVPVIDIHSDKGKVSDRLTGEIRLENVRFAYPGRADLDILKGISLTIEPNKKIALVGESGCGKSTIMQLIERFYDVTSGELLIDNVNIKDYHLKSLRQHIGYVGQEPVLFNTTIRENLLIANAKATEEMMIDALKKAKAYDFVMDQKERLMTMVGTGGAKLSGGQKQRLAIARAILKNPTILLLDEATSALDRTNEIAIQKTLDEISHDRTTVIIAHRLSTIRDSDIIYVLDGGVIVESGNHDKLMGLKGKYFTLVQNQEQIAAQLESSPQREKGADKQVELLKEENEVVADGQLKAVNEDGKPVDAKKKEEDVSFSRLWEFNKPEMPLFVLGIIAAAGNGAVFPLMSIALADIIAKLTVPGALDFRSTANELALFFVYLAIGALVVNFVQTGCFTFISEKLTTRLRQTLFSKILRMHVGWFDEEENQPGNLAASLSTDTTNVKNMTANVMGLTVQAISSFITGMIIAFIASWKLTLVSLAASPVIFISGKLQAHFIQGFSESADGAYKASGSLISEAVNNMRTVASFGNEEKLVAIYDKMLEKPTADAGKKGHVSGFFFGMSNFTMFGIYALVFYVGAIFNRDDGLSIANMYRSIFSIIFAAFGSGQIAQFMPDVGAAKSSVKKIYAILDAKSLIDTQVSGSVKNDIQGLIEFRNVSFKYPTRDAQVLNNISFIIKPGQKIALVGPSGCGKSTIIQLLQRFYDVDEGTITIDGVNIKEYDLIALRKQFGVVSQEPVLFNGTIEYNMKYANPTASEEEMKAAARKANALDFILKNEFDEVHQAETKGDLGTGFNRMVGPKGSQLSGGQKQRIAIGRAILKKPNIYLFDEATSALDTVSEKVVQDALNTLMQDQTSITIAHRLSTIRDVDEIMVLHKGEIIERGDYQQLVNKQGTFYKMEKGILE